MRGAVDVGEWNLNRGCKMLDTFVVNQLGVWAEWRLRRQDNGQGFPKQVAAFTRNGPRSSATWNLEMDSAAYDMERCVLALIPERKLVVMQQYTVSSTQMQKARACGCVVNTFKQRLTMAHRDLLGYLNDLASGIQLPFNGLVVTEKNNLAKFKLIA